MFEPATTKTLFWFFVLVLVTVLIALLVWWIVSLSVARSKRDAKIRDLFARDVCTSESVNVGCDLTVGGISSLAALQTASLAVKPHIEAEAAITLDGLHSTIVLTSTGMAPVQVTLPPIACHSGQWMMILNESTPDTFIIAPASNDTIEGSTLSVTAGSSAFFVSAGILSTGMGDWKQLV